MRPIPDCFNGHYIFNLRDEYDKNFIVVPAAASLDCDISQTALENAIHRYQLAYGEDPTTIVYARTDRSLIHHLRYGEYSTETIQRIQYWVELPLNNDNWMVAGEKGLVLGEGV